MHYLIGTDEAGYGPNLGPLVVSATVWEVPDGLRHDDLYGHLVDVIGPSVQVAAQDPGRRVAMADSKVLYRPGQGLRHLERGVWAALAALGPTPGTWSALWQALAPDSAESLDAIPWYVGCDVPVPVEIDLGEVERLGELLRCGLAAAGVRLVELVSRAVFPGQFNELLRRHDSKAAALSWLTLELVSDVMQPLSAAAISILCDKHGSRSRYGRLLAEHFPEWLIEVYGEGRRRSIYRFGPPDHRVEIRFQTGAEACLPAALASMASKYLRELAMRALNDFWRRRVRDLRPTAGYPRDAKRFKAQIGRAQSTLQIADQVLWRAK